MENFKWISVKDKMPEDGVDVLVCGVFVCDGNYMPFVRVGCHEDDVYVEEYYYKSYEEPKEEHIPKWVIEDITYYIYSDFDYIDREEYRENEDYIVTSWAPLPDASEEALKLVTSKP